MNFFVLAIIAFLPLEAYSAAAAVPTKPVEIHLGEEVNVGGEQVVLGDVATIYAKSLQNFKALSGLVISQIPDDKSEIKLPASYLEARIRAALPEGVEFALRSPGEIVFKLKRLGLTSQDLSAEILRLARAAGKISEGIEAEVQPISGTDRLAGYNLSNARIEPAGETQKWKGEMAFKVVRIDGSAAPVWVRARVRWFQKAWVANRALSYTDRPDISHFSEGRVETTNWREEPLNATKEQLEAMLQTSKVKRSIVANAALVASALERRPDASPGSLLRVVFISEGGVRVSADGSLVGAGSIGSDAKAKLRSSRKIVTGKLVSQGVMEVSL